MPAMADGEGTEAFCDQALKVFLKHRIATHLLKAFEVGGWDLRELTVSESIWKACSTHGVMPPIQAGHDGRIALSGN